MIEVLLFPLLVLAAALDVGDEGVEGDGLVVVVLLGFGQVEGGADLDAAVAVVGGLVRGVGD